MPANVALVELVHLAKHRWIIERDYQELKQELGLGHYEGRGWRGFHHHATLCIAAYGFLVAERNRFSPSARASHLLQVTRAIELGGDICPLCSAYLRGEAYLRMRDGKRAAVEFQKLIDHPGIVLNSIYGALARLGVARAANLDAVYDPAARAKARAAYEVFLTLWKDADPGLPILKQAQAEYARLLGTSGPGPRRLR